MKLRVELVAGRRELGIGKACVSACSVAVVARVGRKRRRVFMFERGLDVGMNEWKVGKEWVGPALGITEAGTWLR